MVSKGKLSFFKKMFFIITDFRTYPFLIKNEKLHKSLFYIITLLLIFTTIFTISIVVNLNHGLEILMGDYDSIIPEFDLSNGKLIVDDKIERKIGNEAYLVINTDFTYDEYINNGRYRELVIYDSLILVNNNRITIELNNGNKYEILFSDFTYELDKQALKEEIISISVDNNYKIHLIFTIFISIFFMYLFFMTIKILTIACLISIICFMSGIGLNFANYIKIAIYVSTLPTIVEFIAIYTVGAVEDYAYYASMLLLYVYIFYAVRAIKLDALIIMFKHHKKADTAKTEINGDEGLLNTDNESDDEKVDKEKNDTKSNDKK